MHFSRESDLQQFLFDFFEETGDSPRWEVPTIGGGRVDIVTDRYVIECKKTLTRSSLFHANGQIGTYRGDFLGKKLVIAGLLPSSGDSEARNVAERLRMSGCLVWFIDEMEVFQDFYQERYELDPEPEPVFSMPDFTDYWYEPSQRSYSNSDDWEPVGWVVGGLVGLFLIIGIGASSGGSPVHKLHNAARAWDQNLVEEALQELLSSQDGCQHLLGVEMSQAFSTYGL
ncbi:hypothetical protein C8255_08865 [filamentous cyanobacterium CCP3]|nr:hypothetical protein C8255_08865 [filamentous cyanobacterium CCP3]